MVAAYARHTLSVLNRHALRAAAAARPPLAQQQQQQQQKQQQQQCRALSRSRPRKATDEAHTPPAPRTIGDLDIRVGVFTEAASHPDSDKLYVEQIDVGEEAPWQIVSGLQAHYTVSELDARRCLVVCNLPKAKLAGTESFGMVMCAASLDGATVEFVTPPEAAAPGTKISVHGHFDDKPLGKAGMKKKKAWAAVAAELAIVDGVACWQGIPLTLSGDETARCATATITAGPIS